MWGRRAYDIVKSLGENYLDEVKSKIIILSENEIRDVNIININNLSKLNKLELKNILICGGKQVYELSIKELNIKNFIFNINFFNMESGVKFPKLNSKLKLIKVCEKQKEFVQIKLKKDETKEEV